MFTLRADWRSEDPYDVEGELQRMLDAQRRYRAYLEENKAKFPESAFAFASAEWRNDFADHRAPHDSWVTEIRFHDGMLPRFPGSGRRDLELVLLGAYHDGHLHLRYSGVKSFSIAGADLSEVYRDEVRLADCGDYWRDEEAITVVVALAGSGGIQAQRVLEALATEGV